MMPASIAGTAVQDEADTDHLLLWRPLAGPGWTLPAGGTAGKGHPGCCESSALHEV